MARYLIIMKNGKRIEADDARITGTFIEYITKGLHKTFVIASNEVQSIEQKDIGMEGGMRFTGKHDSSFALTPGSIGGPAVTQK